MTYNTYYVNHTEPDQITTERPIVFTYTDDTRVDVDALFREQLRRRPNFIPKYRS